MLLSLWAMDGSRGGGTTRLQKDIMTTAQHTAKAPARIECKTHTEYAQGTCEAIARWRLLAETHGTPREHMLHATQLRGHMKVSMN